VAAAALLWALAAWGCGAPLPGVGVGPAGKLDRAGRHRVDAVVQEPSDLAFDAETGTFWTVSDQNGTVYRITRDGRVAGPPIRTDGVDLEGIAVDPGSGHLFVLDEGRRTVTEMTRDGTEVHRFTVPGKGKDLGLEGIAYDARRGELVLVNEANPAEVIFCSRDGKILRRTRVATEDLSAVAIAPGGETLLVMGRFEEALIEVSRTGERLNRFALNVPSVEGVAFDAEGDLYVVSDRGSGAPGELFRFTAGRKLWE
jgi:uncharacterized protein YjiK